ncbi:MAG TPA: 30S ribosomal protein S20 [Alphaproteobacteria bacterium]|nr:30S ribosomal protein S20 [Alphaproteobacteria bacterium]
MANHVSAKKRARQNAKRAIINSANRNRIRTFVKKVELALGAGNVAEAEAALTACQPELQKGVAKGILHKKTASRKLSRLSARIKAAKSQ